MGYQFHVTIDADGKPPYPCDYKETAGKFSTAVARAVRTFEKTKGKAKRNYELKIIVRKLRAV